MWLRRFPNLAAVFSERVRFVILNFLFPHGQNPETKEAAEKRRKKLPINETNVVVRFQRRFPNVADAFSESGCGVLRMLPRPFPNVSVAS